MMLPTPFKRNISTAEKDLLLAEKLLDEPPRKLLKHLENFDLASS